MIEAEIVGVATMIADAMTVGVAAAGAIGVVVEVEAVI